MATQNYSNHKKIKPETTPHTILFIILPALFLFTIADMCHALYVASGRVNAFLFLLISFSMLVAYFVYRPFALKAQDRAIRAEENLRYYVMTGKLLDKSLTISQIIALRFAPDEEFIALIDRAVKENLSNDDIKKAIKNWKADTHRA
jgi:hypothetical protein